MATHPRTFRQLLVKEKLPVVLSEREEKKTREEKNSSQLFVIGRCDKTCGQQKVHAAGVLSVAAISASTRT